MGAECQCGHHAVLTDEMLGEDPAGCMDFDWLRCARCKRKGRPASIIRSWSSTAENGAYRGSYPRG